MQQAEGPSGTAGEVDVKVDVAVPGTSSPAKTEQPAPPSITDNQPHAAAIAEQPGIEVVATSPPPAPSPPSTAAPHPVAELPETAEEEGVIG